MIMPVRVRGKTPEGTANRRSLQGRPPALASRLPRISRIPPRPSPRVLPRDGIASAPDPELVDEVPGVVRKLAQDGMTLILVTHEMRFAREVCDTPVFMHGGRIREQGLPAKLFATPETPELARFIGAMEPA
jgi:ABC-type histidine transport system ATPase subunit